MAQLAWTVKLERLKKVCRDNRFMSCDSSRRERDASRVLTILAELSNPTSGEWPIEVWFELRLLVGRRLRSLWEMTSRNDVAAAACRWKGCPPCLKN